MSVTSSRSARATARPVREPDTSGTLLTEETNETGSSPAKETVWTVEDSSGHLWKIRLPGDGRISWNTSRSHERAGELRIYRSQTTKVFDVVFPDAVRVWSDKAHVEDQGKTPKVKAQELAFVESIVKNVANKHLNSARGSPTAEDDPDD